MINLLPIEEKRKILLRKKEKLALILGIVVLVALVCLILILLSIKFYILTETDSQKNSLAQVEKLKVSSDLMNFSNIINGYNLTLNQLSFFYEKEIYFSDVLDTILSIQKPDNLYLTAFSLDRLSTGTAKVDITGISDSRDDLLIFKKNIEDNKDIKNPSFSSGSWISPKNVKFSLTFEISKDEK